MQSKQQFNIFTLEEANTLVADDFNVNYWIFIVKSMNYQEIQFDSKKQQISCPDFIPFKDLAVEVINDLKKNRIDIKVCESCKSYFNINDEDGIFGNPDTFERFICKICSEKMSAKAFYEKHMMV